MNRYTLTKAGIDCNEGLRRFGGDKKTYEELLRMMLEDPSYTKMLAALDAGDTRKAFEAAHSLKGVSGNLSMVRLHADILPLVEELRHDSLEKVPDLLPPVQASYEEALAGIAKGTSTAE